ncbi:NAD(P)H-dependent glycerol-3-phosphate dehydrogenase [Acetonema longum]|uniref:Glycerol-3-phosphate dehydrogenase [NAD(P)+] n=1 Tax=Acetonema longum DSM 6540 TaxID=1009370 RepID=F7NGB6_9FIRM|nr:NAD(P)H-dependent glycerol-3-phosphate dehydrogenase [Acetonema longum]EGO64909.1 NAD(P)H-dependent glycerol-3-phosphate dehydrogenase [Acetonema longum DSM 6540]
MKIAVIGAGSWGTAISAMLAEKHPASDIRLWARSPETVAEIHQVKENRRYLPGVLLPQSLQCTSDLKESLAGAAVVVMVTPSHAVREIARKVAPIISPDAVIVSATKGLEEVSLKRMSQIIAEEIPGLASRIAVMSGPNHAEEVGRKYPSTTVIAAKKKAIAEQLQDLFMLPYFRVYTNPDVMGVELGGALKNIIALGAGIADGMGFGDNSKAALMTRGLAEIVRLGIALGARPLTFAGLSGVGDLMVTCTSKHSRNYRAGLLLAQGKTISEVCGATNMVVEGIRTAKAAYSLAQQNQIVMPITEQMYHVLYNHKPAKEAVLELMTRGKTHEVEEVAVEPIDWEN